MVANTSVTSPASFARAAEDAALMLGVMAGGRGGHKYLEAARSPSARVTLGICEYFFRDLDPEIAVERLVAHRGFSEADARNRIANQIEREHRLSKADLVIDNHGDAAGLEAEVDRAWSWIHTLPAT